MKLWETGLYYHSLRIELFSYCSVLNQLFSPILFGHIVRKVVLIIYAAKGVIAGMHVSQIAVHYQISKVCNCRNCGHYPSSCLLFKIRDWALPPSLDRALSIGPN
jgi:hypothetical protein